MKRIAISAISALAVIGLVACQKNTTGTLQKQQQQTTNAYQQKLTTAQPYPLGQMNDSAERANLKARLIRLNDPNRIGYVYGLSATGQVMAYWTVRGKVSSMGSQLTVSQNVVDVPNAGNGVVESMGDDGSYGPEECAGQGVFFFTAQSDALVEWCGPWVYSDAPLSVSTAPVIVVNPNAQPSTPIPAGGSSKKP